LAHKGRWDPISSAISQCAAVFSNLLLDCQHLPKGLGFMVVTSVVLSHFAGDHQHCRFQ